MIISFDYQNHFKAVIVDKEGQMCPRGQRGDCEFQQKLIFGL